jgi:hypothetical protein
MVGHSEYVGDAQFVFIVLRPLTQCIVHVYLDMRDIYVTGIFLINSRVAASWSVVVLHWAKIFKKTF